MKYVFLVTAIILAAGGCFHVKQTPAGDADAKIRQLEQRLDRLEKRVDEMSTVKMLPLQ